MTPMECFLGALLGRRGDGEVQTTAGPWSGLTSWFWSTEPKEPEPSGLSLSYALGPGGGGGGSVTSRVGAP